VDLTRILMVGTGILGFALFLTANFSPVLRQKRALAGCLQLVVNALVFLSYSRGYQELTGLGKLVGLIGSIVPLVMASTTTWRVLLPALRKRDAG